MFTIENSAYGTSVLYRSTSLSCHCIARTLLLCVTSENPTFFPAHVREGVWIELRRDVMASAQGTHFRPPAWISPHTY